MDLALNKENVTTLLIDTDSKTLAAGVIPENPDDGPECGKIDISYKGKLSQQNILDKAFSIDENDLATPLEPTQVDSFPAFTCNGPINDEITSDSISDEDVIEEENDLDDKTQTESAETLPLSRSMERISSDDLSQFCAGPCTDITPENISEEHKQTEPILNLATSRLRKKHSPTDLERHADVETLTETFEDITLIHRPILRKNLTKDDDVASFCLYDSKKHVSFPADDEMLVSFRDANDFEICQITEEMSAEEITRLYQESCIKHKTIELDTIRHQIMEIKHNLNHSAVLKLSSVNITAEVNDTLEDLFRVTNFSSLSLVDCKFNAETMNEFLNMLEYYDSVCHLELEMNFQDEDVWKCFCSACSNISVLESLSLKKMTINESYMRFLLRAVKTNNHITTLKFDGCVLAKLPSFYLVENLMINRTIQELYLPSTGLYTKEADCLSRFLSINRFLKVLDISNNFIGDRGLESLSKGLCTQNQPDVGISALSIYNNQLTEKSGPIIGNIIEKCRNLHTFNVGYNNLTDAVLKHINLSLPLTKSLEGLGLQCTLLTCKGVYELAAAIPNNTTLRKINLKGNKAIQVNGVEKLCQALTNSKINKIEIDENNRSCSDPEAYSQLVKKLSAICTVNKSFINEEQDVPDTHIISRKMSLNCEPRYTVPESTSLFHVGSSRLSPIPSPVSSPSPKSRFHIVKVSETGGEGHATSASTSHSPSPSSRSKSRFQVTRVPQSPDEDVSLGRFANVRSSVSSNDSMDSLTTLHLDSDSE
ncbi:protein phosphatase 1 regulatory subunit 37-like isoform X2 [Diabrotica virgifera virgifera]|uniref:Protein phosphatase 1 regulatory subunit 37 n=1 Tax=Diabrotica virgifera virgifera TaxID=50390 RepID=A0ABM5L9R4_DIAVI|nr:protein phosphatase 1 regulatory subunit 37-like isoform X2 [Diabrotica virgifera virgifera]